MTDPARPGGIHPDPVPTPRWVIVFAAVAALAFLLFLLAMAIGGDGQSRHQATGLDGPPGATAELHTAAAWPAHQWAAIVT